MKNKFKIALLIAILVLSVFPMMIVPVNAEISSSLWVERGNTYMHVGRHQEALEAYDKAIEIDPNNTDAWKSKADALHWLGRWQDALEAYSKVLELNPNNAYALQGKGVALDSLGRCQDALDAYDKALEIEPNYLEVLAQKGWTLDCLGKHQEAIATAQEVIDICDKLIAVNVSAFGSGNPWHYKGSELNFLGEYEDALKASDKAISIDPNNPHTWNQKGDALFALERYQEAVDAYNKAIEINPYLAHFWCDKGKALDALGRHEEADEAYDKAFELTASTTTSTPTPTPFPSLSFHQQYPYLLPIALILLILFLLPLIIYRKSKKDKSTPPSKTPTDKSELKPDIQEEIPSPISESVTIERTIYNPTKRNFIISTQRPLTNVKSWIEKNDPSMYWFVMCINNNSDKPIDEWGIELEAPSTLKILDARIEGTEQKFYLKESSSKPWLTNWILGISHHLGIVIPRKGSKRIYFKLGSDACETSYSIKDKVSTPDGETPIKEKQFKYSCDVNTLDNAIVTDPKGAKDLVSSVIRSYYTGKEAVRIIDSFEEIIGIYNVDGKTRADELKSKLKQLRSLIFEDSLLDKIDVFYRGMEQELFDSCYLDSNYARRTKQFCEEFIKDWKGEFLR